MPLVWRTSTPEPTNGDGIIWTYLKDATQYIPLFSKPGPFIFELDNLLDTERNGQYASRSRSAIVLHVFAGKMTICIGQTATVSATFFASSIAHPPAKKADLILPISANSGSSPDDNAPSVPPTTSVSQRIVDVAECKSDHSPTLA